MRIIAGEHRGRRIEAPPGPGTRPMLDRVREALFSTLGARIENARVLDLFAGSGSLGLEALSRGARSARMIERNSRALAILKQNVELLGMGDRSEIVRGDALRRDLWFSITLPEAPDIVFLDPPYPDVESLDGRSEILLGCAELLAEIVTPMGCLVLHAPARGIGSMRVDGPWRRDERRYGNSGLLYLYKRAQGEHP